MEKMLVSPSPQIRDNISTSKVMTHVLVALCPALAMSAYVFGGRALMLTGFCMITALIWERLCNLIMKRPDSTKDVSALVTGMLLAFNLPVTMPYWQAAIGTFVAIVIVKQLFGGIGKNFVNPALAARVFLFSWAGDMSTFQKFGEKINSAAVTLTEGDIVAGATPLASLKQGVIPDANIFDMLTGNMGGCIGEVSSILLIAGGVFLLVRRVITWQIPVAYIGTVALVTFLLPKGGGIAADFMLYELLSGGLMLGAIFMATDYSTSPVTLNGRLLYGCGCGLITVLIRYFGSYPEGVSFAILIMNLLVWYIDKLTMPRRFGGKR